jgi:hypothetical protein
MLWIDAFNSGTGMLWMTSGSHSRPYDNWALPCAAGEVEGVGPWRRFDEHVVMGVYTVRKLAMKRISASSGSDSDGSEGTEDYRIGKIWAGDDVAGLPVPMIG